MLPRELAEQIVEYLSFRQRMNACLVSKPWAQFIRSSPNLWQHLDLSGARKKKVRSAFISRAINVGRSKLTTATLSNLYDFDKTVAVLVKHCPLEELNLLDCGLQGDNLTRVLTFAKDLKSLSLGHGTDMLSFELVQLLELLSEQLESFHSKIDYARQRDGSHQLIRTTFGKLTTLSLTIDTTPVLRVLLADFPARFPVLKSLTIHQDQPGRGNRIGEHIDLEKCTQLQHLDLRLVLSTARLLTLPPSLVVVNLNPLLVPNPARFFRDFRAAPEPEPTCHLPHLRDLALELPALSLFDVTYMWDMKSEQVWPCS